MSMMRKVGLVSVLAIVAVACSSSTSSSGSNGGSDGGTSSSADAGATDAATSTPDGATETDAGVVLADAASDASTGDGSASCSFVGTWTGTVPGGALAGGTLVMVISANGTYSGTIGAFVWGGNWALNGDALTVSDTSGSAPCPAGQVGGYTETFAPSCNAADFAVTTDQCAGRAAVIDKLHLTRM